MSHNVQAPKCGDVWAQVYNMRKYLLIAERLQTGDEDAVPSLFTEMSDKLNADIEDDEAFKAL